MTVALSTKEPCNVIMSPFSPFHPSIIAEQCPRCVDDLCACRWETLSPCRHCLCCGMSAVHGKPVFCFVLGMLMLCPASLQPVNQLRSSHTSIKVQRLYGGGRGLKSLDRAKQKEFALKGVKKKKKIRYKAGTKDYQVFAGPHMYAIGGRCDKLDQTLVHRFDVTRNEWTVGEHMLSPRAAFGAVRLQGRIFVVGGTEERDPLDSVHTFCPYSSGPKWARETLLPFPRRLLAVAALHDKLFVVGGAGKIAWGNHTINDMCYRSVQSYDPDTKSWENHTDMSFGRRHHAVVACRDRLYVLGGWRQSLDDEDGDLNLASMESYDPWTGEWQAEPPMPTARRSLQAVVLQGRIYAIGGVQWGKQLGAVESFDPVEGAWRTEPELVNRRSSFSAAAFNGKIYVAGGVVGHASLKSVECFDPALAKWQPAPDLPSKRWALSLVPC